jgi:NADH-quinone oxidoreductase subunit A
MLMNKKLNWNFRNFFRQIQLGQIFISLFLICGVILKNPHFPYRIFIFLQGFDYILMLMYFIYNINYFYYTSDSLFRNEYLPVLLIIITALVLSCIILGFSFFFVVQKPDIEKLSTYECGFEPYNDSRHKFDIKFYLLAIIFIVFDIETAFLLPWSVSLSKLNILGFWSMIDFVFELNFVYLYIWSIGALDWD